MEWSPQFAMKAYLHSLQLSRREDNTSSYGSTKLVEPKCMEFISALAAGKQAKLMVEITTQGITPLTISLAVAAKQTGGKLICILPHHHQQQNFINKCRNHDLHLPDLQDLEDVIEFVPGNPFQVAMQYKKIDFLAVDGKLEGHLKLLEMVDLNPSGCLIVGHNLQYREYEVSFGQVLNRKKGIDCVSLPIGEGMELTRIESFTKRKCRRFKRFHVIFEN
uniref:S-adenosyl-L-methionine-dependent methyltransferase n=2 Tax=Manihot esculenta TaxID=3983 RepID=A0A2C9WGL0_MANES